MLWRLVLYNFAQFSISFPFFLSVNFMQGSGKGSGDHEKGSRTNQQRLPKAGGSHFIYYANPEAFSCSHIVFINCVP
jgi:hypothetical protein